MDESDDFKFFGLGGCNEVGRSCHIIEYKNKIIMLDAGVHPGHSGLLSLPFYDEFDLSKVDILLILHFHLDHAASLPYVMQHTNFKGRVFMTHATKAIYRWLLLDFVRVTSIGNGGDTRTRGGSGGGMGTNSESLNENLANLYTDDDLMRSFDRIETIDYHSTIEIEGIRFTAYHAGHVLGACMYFVEIGGLKILFTGDYLREEDRHLHIAEVPPQRPDILITELTFGTATHEPRLEKEQRMTNIIHSTLAKGGRILMPVFALGRAQELLLILEEFWLQNEDLHGINIFYALSLARKCMAVYQTYTNIMNDNIRTSLALSGSGKLNPFQFKHIKSIKSLDKFQDFGPCVVVAAPGMLQNGVLRELLEKWAPDPKNAVIMTGYSVEGTMAKELLTEPPSIQSCHNPEVNIPRRLNIEEISFAAHVDFEQNAGFIDLVNPLKIILVHGESNPMGRLKLALLSKYSARRGTDQEIKVFNPRNCDELRLSIKGLRIAKVLGLLGEEQLAMLKSEIDRKVEDENRKIEELDDAGAVNDGDQVSQTGAGTAGDADEAQKANGKLVEDEDNDTITAEQPVSGLLVSKDFDLNLLQLQDLHEYTQLSTSIVKSKLNLKIDANIDLIKWHLEQMFGYIEVINDDADEWEVLIMDSISVIVDHNATAKAGGGSGMLVAIEWINDNLMADSLADSVVAILYSVDSSPASVKLSSKRCLHSHTKVKTEDDQDTEMKDTPPPSGKLAHANTEILLRIHRIATLLRAQFGDTFVPVKGKELEQAVITIGKNEAHIDYLRLTVECGSKVLRDRIETVLRRGSGLAAPLSQYQKT